MKIHNIDEFYHWRYSGQKETHLDLSEIEPWEKGNLMRMFEGCESLKEVIFPKQGFDAAKYRDLDFMFRDCHSLERVDLSSFDFSNIKSMDYMFEHCTSLKEVILPRMPLNASIRACMREMFCGCKNLTRIDMSGLNLSEVFHMSHIFLGCTSLEEVLLSDTILDGLHKKIKRETGKTRQVESWNIFDAPTRQSAEIQGLISTSTIHEYIYIGFGEATEEERRYYLSLEDTAKLTIVPHKSK